MDEMNFSHPPQFNLDADGKSSTVTLRAKVYITLLIRADVTDPALWPPGFDAGAAALARVREIESECADKQGKFDWEKLPPELQDEYDALSVSLDSLQEGDSHTAWESYKRTGGSIPPDLPDPTFIKRPALTGCITRASLPPFAAGNRWISDRSSAGGLH